jgi:hypothetical protein
MLAPNGAGSSVDTLSRIIGARSSEVIGQRIIIDNRAGARRGDRHGNRQGTGWYFHLAEQLHCDEVMKL